MSRSHHITRKDIVILDGIDRHLDVEGQDELRHKSQVKRNALAERNLVHTINEIKEAIIPVNFKDYGKNIYYPLNKYFVDKVISTFTVEELQSLSSINFELGSLIQEEAAKPDIDHIRDPIFNRPCYECSPNVYAPLIQGHYVVRKRSVHIFAYVLGDAEIPIPEDIRDALWLNCLTVIIHEIGHYLDYNYRIKNGRWVFSKDEQFENFADAFVAKWFREYIKTDRTGT